MNFERISPRDAIVSTVVYADIFDYPLRRNELSHWMLINVQHARKIKEVEMKDGYWFLKGRIGIIKLRRDREAWQEKKWNIAKRAAGYLSWIPTVQLVGVTGGLAMNNAKREDDIDLFLITSYRTLWISRLLSTVLMSVFQLRRRPGEIHVANKVCLNMFMAPQYTKYFYGLDIPSRERDCFAAHEVLQMRPIWEQPGVYNKFIRSNSWVEAYLPVAYKQQKYEDVPGVYETPVVVLWLFRLVEYPAKWLQLWYMKKRRTNEVITNTILRFHPRDARIWIKRKFAKRLRRFSIPLDKIFYAS